MKTNIVVTFLLATVMAAEASLYTVGVIPDGSPMGASFIGTYDQANSGDTVSSLSVRFSISGGYNGNLYAYLVAPNGTLVTLLNQPGANGGNPFGFAGSGMNVTLSDAVSGSIQSTPETAGAVFSGTYNAVGTLGTFNNSSADGTWTLYFADVVAGGGQAQLTGWSLDITAVPEPVNVALGVFGMGFIGVGVARRYIHSR